MPTLFARGDVVFGNAFLYDNIDEAEPIDNPYYGRRFRVNSPDGYVIPRAEPGSSEGVPNDSWYRNKGSHGDVAHPEYNIFVLKNGETYRFTHTYYHDGVYWGVMGSSHIYQPTGWVPMDNLLILYEREDFEAETQDFFYAYTGSFDALLSTSKLVEWQWPGADRERIVYYDKETIIRCAKVLYAYKDPDGREWGKAAYTEGWICLSDPGNSSKIPAFYPAPDLAQWIPGGIYDWSAKVTIWPPKLPPVDDPFNPSPDNPIVDPTESLTSEASANNLNLVWLVVPISVFVAVAVVVAVFLIRKSRRA